MRRRAAISRTIPRSSCYVLLIISGAISGCSVGIDRSSSPVETAIASPTFYPEAGTYTSPQSVTITDSSGGVRVYYTLDGTSPTSSSLTYTGAIAVSTDITIKAIAVADGKTPSAIASAPFAFDFPVASPPSFSVAPGTYTTTQSVSLSSDVPGAQIHFTSDGSLPTISSAIYSAPILISSSTTIRAVTSAYGFQLSPEVDGTYSIDLQPAPSPVFVPAAGTFNTSQTISITASTPGSVIYYTTDGSLPTLASPRFTSSISLSSEGSTTLRAVATAPGYAQSTISSATYVIDFPAAAEPTTSPAAGDYSSVQNVVLADAAPGASIFYTTDGSSPTPASMSYTLPIIVTTSTNIRAIATAPNFTPSAVSSNRFRFPAAAPAISPLGGTYTKAQVVTLSDAVPGASIFYTLDGSRATSASTPYIGPFSLSGSTTVNAVAWAPNFSLSPLTTAAYTIYTTTPAAVLSPRGGSFTSAQSVTLSDALSGAAIYYTLDGTTPTSSSTLYTVPIAINTEGSTTLSAFATCPGLSDSAVTSAQFTLTLPASGLPAYTYKSVQIVGGGFVDGLYFHPALRGLMYAHTDIGGAYRWNAAGGETQWGPLNDSIGRFNNGFDLAVQSLAIDPSDSTHLYLAVGAYTENYGTNGAVLASSDMGNTFTSVEVPFKNGGNDSGRNDGDRLVVDPNNGKHLYLGTFFNGLYESLDRAATWKQATEFPVSGATTNAEDPEVGIIFEQFVASSGTAANGNTKSVYFGVSSPTKGLYQSQDGGVSFSVVPGQPTGYYPNAEAFDAVNNILYITYAVTQGCSQSCSHAGPIGPNAGQVWSYKLPTSAAPAGIWKNITPPQTTPAGGSYGFNSVAVDPSRPSILVVTTLNKYYPAPYDDLFRSTDSGATWFNLNTNAVRDVSLAPWVSTFEPGNWFNHFVIDPFDPNHALYGNGQTIWATNDLESADGVATSTNTSVHGNPTHWTIGAPGLEETAILAMVSPPSGPAHLLSQVYDLGGFTHVNPDESPSFGQQKTPLFTSGTSMDFAQNNPLLLARVGLSSGTAGTTGQGPGSLRGGYSKDGGLSWAPFANDPPGATAGAGTVAVSADGATIVWMPADGGANAAYSSDNGTTWKASTGGPSQTQSSQPPFGYIQVYADRVNATKFYLFDSSGRNGRTPIYISTDGGHSYTLAATPVNYDTGFAVSPKAEGDIWLTGYNGLYHSADSASTFTQASGVENSFAVSFGAPAPAATYPTIFFVGHVTADTTCVPTSSEGFTVQTQCIYRSTDGGQSFLLINNFAHQYGQFNLITGDPRVFGRVYFGTNGRGIIQADSPN